MLIFAKLPGVDFVYDLNKELPKNFHNEFDIVHSKCVLDHLGNPLNFLEGCKKYLKKDGKFTLIIDNGDYWRFHFHLGTYHASIWEEDDPDHPETHHKMLFQMKHLTKLLKLIGFKDIKAGYFSDYDPLPFYKKVLRGHLDFLMPTHIGKNMIKIEAIKP